MLATPDALRVLFVVQGEGRGHMTQALAAAEVLRSHEHTVVHVLIGQNERRRIPRFFADEIGAPLMRIPSPNFASDDKGAVHLGKTVLVGARNARRYAASLSLLNQAVKDTQPDVIVNFYEGLVGLWTRLYSSRVPVVAVGHQFMFEHPVYPFPPGQALQRLAIRRYTTLVGSGATARLALSFYNAAPTDDPRLHVTPPLLRRQVQHLDGSQDDGSLLVYLIEPALAEGLRGWCRRNPDVPVHCFWDGPAHREDSLHFHALDGTHFLQRMARTRGVVCTAGFESVSEALWLGKPVFMLPVPGHFEQKCNARDAARIGAGLVGDTLDLDTFLAYLPTHTTRPDRFRAWAAQADAFFVQTVEDAAGVPTQRQAA